MAVLLAALMSTLSAIINVTSGVVLNFQLCLGIIPLSMFLKDWTSTSLWLVLCAGTLVVLYFTWYKYFPSPDER